MTNELNKEGLEQAEEAVLQLTDGYINRPDVVKAAIQAYLPYHIADVGKMAADGKPILTNDEEK